MRTPLLRTVVVIALIVTFTDLRVSAQARSPIATPSTQPSPKIAQLIDALQNGSGRARVNALHSVGEAVGADPTVRDDATLFAAFAACAEDKDPQVRAEVARTMGQIWVWGANPQKLEAIEVAKKLARDGNPNVVHSAVYFSLSTARDKTDDVIRAMFDAAAAASHYDPVNLHGRMAWGLKGQSPQRIAALCEPYWAKRETGEKGAYLIYRLYVEITEKEPPQPERFAAIKAKVAEREAAQKRACEQRVPALAAAIRDGDSEQRSAALREINATKFMWQALNADVLDALIKAADDPSPRVRAEVARMTFNRWIWGTREQDPKAITLALRLLKDDDPAVRYNTVYFGLSTVWEPSDDVVRALVDSTIAPGDPSMSGRAVWGLKRVPADRVVAAFQPYFDKGGETAARAAKPFTEATGGPPPRPVEAQAKEAAANSYASAFEALFLHLAETYPRLEAKPLDWDAIRDALSPKAAQVKTDRDFGLLCLQLVARLEDSHAQLLPGTAALPTIDFPKYDPGFACLIDDRDRPVVYHVDRDSPAEKAGVKIGMAVVSVNGTPAEQAMKTWMDRTRTYVGYSSDRYLRDDAAKGFCRQEKPGDVVAIETEDLAGKKHEFKVPATLSVRYLPRLPVPIDGIDDSGGVEAKRLDERTGYVYVRRIRGDLPGDLDAAVKALGDVKGLIIDVRGNSGGGFDAQRSFRNFDPGDNTEPARPRYAGPIALMIDARCISAGEGWASWFIANKRARVFGTTTAGASSRKAQYVLTNGLYKVVVPVKAYTGFLDRPIERRGLEPDVEVRNTAADLAAGKDTVLETAKAWLREQSAADAPGRAVGSRE